MSFSLDSSDWFRDEHVTQLVELDAVASIRGTGRGSFLLELPVITEK